MVERMLTNPRLCGYRTYRGELLLDDDGRPVIGQWEPINTVEEWEAVCAVVTEREVRCSTPERVWDVGRAPGVVPGALSCVCGP
ncbi:recombinase family protein [Streptomyces collinus]|uniref:recombinase family protein n=1 Tax=Streptomyces collinus TaxID=42684 RepID=UPI0033B63E21